MEKKEYTEIMNEYHRDEDIRLADKERVNIRLFKTLLHVKGVDWIIYFCRDLKESECNGDISFVKTAQGQLQQNYWGSIKGVYVEQYCEMEDSYYGNIYFPVKSGKYLK